MESDCKYLPLKKYISLVVLSCLWLFILIIYLMIGSDMCVSSDYMLYILGNTVKACTGEI